MLYAAVTMTAIIACCYLLLRRGNAFAPDNTPPLRLRRWTAAFIASKMKDREVFHRYFAKYDSIRSNLPEQFNAANLQQVMVCHSLMQNDYQRARFVVTGI